MVRVGVVGVGHLGAHHARLYRAHAGAQLVGIHDIDRDRMQAVADDLEATAFPALEPLIDAVDALSIVVPTVDHRAIAELALARGVASLVEKPLAPTVEDARAIVEVARQNGAPLMVGHVERWNGAFRSILPHVERPRFIESHRLAAFPGRGLDVDVIRDLMIHDLDLVLAVSQAPVASVQAVGVSVLTGSADIANARIEFEDGMVANLTASRASREPVRKMRIFQDDAYLSSDFMKRSAELYRRRAGAPPLVGGDRAMSAMAILSAIEHQSFGPVDDPEPLAAELDAFIAAVRSGLAPEPGGDDGVRALELALRVTESMARAAERMGVPASPDGAALPAAPVSAKAVPEPGASSPDA